MDGGHDPHRTALVPPLLAGTHLTEATGPLRGRRDVQLEVVDGWLVGRCHDREVRVAVADVRRLVLLDGSQLRRLRLRPTGPGGWDLLGQALGSLVVMTGAGPALVVHLADAVAHDVPLSHSSTGVEALAGALGVRLEEDPALELDPDRVRQVLVAPPAVPRSARSSSAAAAVALALGVSVLLLEDPGPSWWRAALLTAGVALSGWLVALLALAQVRFRAGARRAPTADDQACFPDRVSSPARSRLLLGRDEVVLWSGWRLVRRPGPAQVHGAVRCVIGPDAVQLRSVRGTVLLDLETSELLPDAEAHAALRRACGQVGIAVEDRSERLTEDPGVPVPWPGHLWTFDRHLPPEHRLSPDEQGALGLVTPLLTALALLAQAAGVLAVAEAWDAPWWPGLAVVAALAAVLAGTHLSFRRARRSVLRANPRRVPAPRLDRWRSRVGGVRGTRFVYHPPA